MQSSYQNKKIEEMLNYLSVRVLKINGFVYNRILFITAYMYLFRQYLYILHIHITCIIYFQLMRYVQLINECDSFATIVKIHTKIRLLSRDTRSMNAVNSRLSFVICVEGSSKERIILHNTSGTHIVCGIKCKPIEQFL